MNNPEKEIELTVKDYQLIKSNSIQNWIQCNRPETALVEAVINAFIGFCNSNGLTVKDGKILK